MSNSVHETCYEYSYIIVLYSLQYLNPAHFLCGWSHCISVSGVVYIQQCISLELYHFAGQNICKRPDMSTDKS